MMGWLYCHSKELVPLKTAVGNKVRGQMATAGEGIEQDSGDAEGPRSTPALSPAAERALAEAESRRAEADRREAERPEEVGRKGPDPARYGDWEKNGIASDF
jgi:hypothetical protein